MEKALNILKDLCLVINFNSYWKPRVEDAIAELEEAMKPKTCDGCKYFRKSDKACFMSSQNTYIRPASIYFSGCGKHEPKEQ